MSLGTGIFLSSLVLATVILYGFTKVRGRWGKMIGWTLLVVIGGVAAVTAIGQIRQYWEEWFPPQLGRQTQYAGLKLGISPQEVMYIKGYPPPSSGKSLTQCGPASRS